MREAKEKAPKSSLALAGVKGETSFHVSTQGAGVPNRGARQRQHKRLAQDSISAVSLQAQQQTRVMEARDLTVTYPQASQTLVLSASAIPRRRLLRIKQASEYLSLSPWKLRQLIQCGKLPVVQDTDGSPFLLDVRDLDGFVERSKRISPI
jgi:excisionase family DNA binding protein